jgi:hypothetical protein
MIKHQDHELMSSSSNVNNNEIVGQHKKADSFSVKMR